MMQRTIGRTRRQAMVLIGFLLASAPAAAIAQTTHPNFPLIAPEDDGIGNAPDFQSPTVAPDGRVTLRLWAPAVNQAFILIDGLGFLLPEPMQKTSDGLWIYTTPKLAPDIYSYNFVVGGAQIADPANTPDPTIIYGPPNLQSQFVVPGHPPRVWEETNAPHGAVAHYVYHSQILGAPEDYYVYTPPGYAPTRATPYPVLYLLHGLGDSAAGWLSSGRANLILDNLIATGQATPMIMVMPRSYGIANIAALNTDPSAQALQLRNFASLLLNEIDHRVARDYRISHNPNQRALAGLSMGGAEALSIGIAHSDIYANVASFSAGLPMLDPDFAKAFPAADHPQLTRNLKLLWVSCGTDDPLIDPTHQLEQWLGHKNIRFSAVETPGGHEWPVWRRNLAQFVQLLFKRPSG